MRGQRAAVRALGVAGVLAAVAAWSLYDIGSLLQPTPSGATAIVQGGVCGDSVVDIGEDCDDGNLIYGDGCTPNCRLEECPSVGNCADGLDNDGDGLIDYTDPDCATVSVLQRYALLASGSGDSFRSPGLQVGLGAVVKSTDVNALMLEIVDPLTAVPYPVGPSKADLCGGRTRVRKIAQMDGSLISDGDIFFSAKIAPRPVVGNLLVHTGVATFGATQGAPYVGLPQFCTGGVASCVVGSAGAACTGSTLCEERYTYAENLANPPGFVDPIGTGIGAAALADCTVARGTAVSLNPLIYQIPPDDVFGAVVVDVGQTVDIPVAPGNHVVRLRRLRLRMRGTLRLVGQVGQENNTNLLVEFERGFILGRDASIQLVNLNPDRVIYVADPTRNQGVRGFIRSNFDGTMLAMNRFVRLGFFTQYNGAAFGRVVRVHRDITFQHKPFIGMLDTDLGIAKSSSVTNPPGVVAGTEFTTAGTPVTYTLTVTNSGPSNALGTVVTDTLDSGVDYVAGSVVTTPAGLRCVEPGTGGGGTLTCYLDTLTRSGGAQDTAVVTFDVHVDPSTRGSVTNQAVVAINEPTDYDAANDTASVVDTVFARADLEVTNAVGSPVITPGGAPATAGNATAGRDVVTYEFTVTNYGPSDATNVVVLDPLPAGLTLVAGVASSTQGACTDDIPQNRVVCNIGTLVPVGDPSGTSSATVTVKASVDCDATGNSAQATLTNTASGSATETDPGPRANSASQNVTVEEWADVGITKSGATSVTAGGMLTYTIDVTNTAGFSDARSVVVTDTLPAGTTFVSFPSGLGCNHAGGTITCNLGTMACGSSTSRQVQVKVGCVQRANLTNTASLNAAPPRTKDQNGANDTSSVVTTTVGTSVSLGITKSDSPDPVLEGATLTYSVTATNTGTSSALNATVTDTLPAGLTFNPAASSASCSAVGQNVTCTLGTLTCVTGTSNVTIGATVGTATNGNSTELSNTAKVTSDEDAVGATSAVVTTNIVKANGGTCAAGAADCSSTNCVDGFCCNTGCGGTCESCAVTGSEGTCTGITLNTDPDNDCALCQVCDGNGGGGGGACINAANGSDPAADCAQASASTCGQDGQCDGAGACRLWASGTVCVADSCATLPLTYSLADTCDGAGVCVDNGTQACDDGNVCTDDTCNVGSGCANTNNTAVCDDGLFCTTGDTCSGGACVGGAGTPCTSPADHPVSAICNDACNEAANNCTANDTNGLGCNNSLGLCNAGTCPF